MEETGCELEEFIVFGISETPQNGMHGFPGSYVCSYHVTENGNFDKKCEVDSKLWVKRDEVMDWLKNNIIRCGGVNAYFTILTVL